MLSSFFSSPVWQLIAMSDWISKWVVMFGLFILSVVCIAIIIFKAINFYKDSQHMKQLLRQTEKSSSFDEIMKAGKTSGSGTGEMFLAAAERHAQQITAGGSVQKEDLEQLEIMLEQEVSKVVRAEETYLPVLGTSAAVSPLLGLFGTICGLINSFMSISQEKSADIATVAPGIASALMTTLAGLVVAIPAMIAFHYFSNELRKKQQKLYDLSDLVMIFLRKTHSS